MVGAEKRIRLIAKDIVEHFEKRYEALGGKAMVVCMSRRICVDLFAEIAKLRPLVKRILRKHGYPPDKQEKATQTVLSQAALIAKDWAG